MLTLPHRQRTAAEHTPAPPPTPAHTAAPSAAPTRPFRWTMAAAEAFVALGALMGTVMLVAGVNTPPLSAIDEIGLESWVLPGVWLFVSVAVPSATAAWLAFRGSRHAPTAVLVASALLIVELAVQLPFLGFSLFQLVFAALAVVLAVVALTARDSGGWDSGGWGSMEA